MEEQRFRRKISIGGRSLVNAFQVKCRTCSALVMMDQDPTTKKWRPMDEKDGQLVPHWPDLRRESTPAPQERGDRADAARPGLPCGPSPGCETAAGEHARAGEGHGA